MSSPTGIGSRRRMFEVLWNLECPVGLSQREICAHFIEENLAQFGWSAEKFEFNRPKCSSCKCMTLFYFYNVMYACLICI